MTELNEKTRNISSSACCVCYKNAKYYSIGMCEHPVCHECSTRMRVLCQQNECPICRQDLPKVVFTREIRPFRLLKKFNLFDRRFNVYFETQEIQNDFNKLLSHKCIVCKNGQVFSIFEALKDHMRREHDLYFCDLCVENLKIFSYERRCYTKNELLMHQRKGDLDDKSHKGHPICEFCDKRYMDNDELYRHLRRDHLFCHFCDADGLHHYYDSYEYLREHFQTEHYLCEEGGCADEQFTSVFRTDIDLKAHKSSVHGKQLGKVAAKQARTLDVEFTLTPRADFRHRRGGGQAGASRDSRDETSASYQRHQHNTREDGRPNHSRNPHIYKRPETPPPLEEPTFVRQALCDVQSTQEFPTLGNAPTRPLVGLVPGPAKSRGNLTIRGVLKNNYNENFPALGPDGVAPAPSSSHSSTLTKSFNASVSSSKPSSSAAGVKPKPAPNVSVHANHRPNGTVMTRLNSGPSLRINTIPSSSMDFPALSRAVAEAATAPVSTANAASWTKVTCVKPEEMPRNKKVAPPPSAALPPTIRSGEDFPSLSKPPKPTNKNPSTPVKPPAPAGPSWMQVQPTATNSSAITTTMTTTTTDATKGKMKKKKIKQQQQNGNESSYANKVNTVSDNNHKNSSNGKETPASSKKGKSKTKQNSDQANAKPNSYESSSNVSEVSKATSTTPVSVQHNRSELKINSINTNNNNQNNNINNKNTEVKTANKVDSKSEDFPVLGRTLSRPPGLPSPPPGFTAPVMTKPPPGFLNRMNELTFNNYSGENYNIVPDDIELNQQLGYTYLPPSEFPRRNQNLVADLNNCLGSNDSEEIKDFQYLSSLFRTGACDADEYYKRCRTVMGSSAFDRIFPELLALLPDIKKQRELFEVYKREIGAGSNKINHLVSCANCGQILHSSDLKVHASSHTLENHFPVLNKAGPPSSTWNK